MLQRFSTRGSLSRPVFPPASARLRSLCGLALALAFVPFLLALLACLPVPLGDPETSQIDAELSGVWLIPESETQTDGLFLLEPYDVRTWLVSMLGIRTNHPSGQAVSPAAPPADRLAALDRDGAEFSLSVMKGWLTTIDGARFLVLEPKLSVDDEAGMKPTAWFAYRVARPAPDTLELRLVKSERSEFEQARTAREAGVVGRGRGKGGG